MSPTILAAVAAAAATAGLLLIAVGLIGTRRPPAPSTRSAQRLAGVFGVGLSTAQRRTRQTLAVLAVLAGAGTWLATGWPVGGLLAGLAVPSRSASQPLGAGSAQEIIIT